MSQATLWFTYFFHGCMLAVWSDPVVSWHIGSEPWWDRLFDSLTAQEFELENSVTGVAV